MAKILDPVDRERPARKDAERAFAKRLKAFFDERKEAIIRPLVASYNPSFAQVKALDDRIEKEVERLLLEINAVPFKDLPEELQALYRGVARDSMVLTVDQIRENAAGADDAFFAELLNQANLRSVEMAKTASAALVGKKWVNGELVDNLGLQPGTEIPWAIDEGTRELIRGTVSSALNEGWTNEELAKRLIDGAAFSEYRAEMIARTELADIDVQANYEAWRASGLVSKKLWLLSSDPCEDCQDNAKVGPIDLDEEFPNGDCPVHPHCSCDIGAIMEDR